MATTAPSVLDVATAAVLIAAGVLVVCCVRQRQPLLLVAYGAAVLAEVVGSAGIMNSRVRLLVPAFTLLLPVVAWLCRLRTSSMIAALAGITVAGSWFSAYGLTIWPYAI
jgi:hypothetical protein